jgi:hypothetical protein
MATNSATRRPANVGTAFGLTFWRAKDTALSGACVGPEGTKALANVGVDGEVEYPTMAVSYPWLGEVGVEVVSGRGARGSVKVR